jgi:hypothetical protein
MRALVIALVVLSTGCASTQTKNTLEALQESVDGYNEAYRWKNYERAASYLPEDMRQSFLTAYEDSDNSLHVEDYQVLKVDLDGDAAKVTLRLRYMQLPSVTVERKTLVQHWHKIGGVWIMETEDNSIREIEKSAPKDSDADKSATKPEQEGDTKVKVTNKTGEVIRDDHFGDEDDAAKKP